MVCCIGGGLRIQEALSNGSLKGSPIPSDSVVFAQGISQNAPVAKQHMAASMYPEAVSRSWGGFP